MLTAELVHTSPYETLDSLTEHILRESSAEGPLGRNKSFHLLRSVGGFLSFSFSLLCALFLSRVSLLI